MSYSTSPLLVALILFGEVGAAPQSPPVIAGLARNGLSSVDRGLVLLGELGCVSCHDAAGHKAVIRSKSAPDLSGAGSRILHPYLAKFLADPRSVKPGTTMPDLLGRMDPSKRAEVAEQLTHFLLASSSGQAAPESVDRLAFPRGFRLFHEVGCVACHLPRDEQAREKPAAGARGVPLGRLHEKYSVSSLIRFLDAPQHVRASGRMPDFNLSPAELYDIGHYLLQAGEPAEPGFERLVVAPAKAAAGKALFRSLGCAACHALDGAESAGSPAPAFTGEADAQRGCLSGTRGAWPFFDLSEGQRRDLSAALAAHDEVPTDQRNIRRALASMNCIACHQRDDFGGIVKDRNEFFTSEDQNLGESGRLPPPLTGVGAKLQSAWLRDAMLCTWATSCAAVRSVCVTTVKPRNANSASLARLWSLLEPRCVSKVSIILPWYAAGRRASRRRSGGGSSS